MNNIVSGGITLPDIKSDTQEIKLEAAAYMSSFVLKGTSLKMPEIHRSVGKSIVSESFKGISSSFKKEK
ncbi:hypothetical protein [Bartonella gabonensis]|uniref:hypothetical protein n=1 Tax=Bartonella gabonensis TaxID=2699889 RepID=UPI00158C41F5|nr:hypothetical protein [Bartonella gabonensis]